MIYDKQKFSPSALSDRHSVKHQGEWRKHDNPLAEILRNQSLKVHFQPIVSLKKKTVIGVESLARATDPESGEALPPQQLFDWAAEQEGQTVELDRLCCRKAMQSFLPLADLPQKPLIFVNFESSVLDKGVLSSGYLHRTVLEAGISPSDVVIEINESKVVDLEALRRFVDIHRRQGFLIALDDLGAGFSNLARIFLLKPEIVKLDRSLIMGIENDFYKREIFKALVGLGRRVGSLILAEGVESEEEVSACVDLGADLAQGYFFGRPAAPDRLPLEILETQLNTTLLRLRQQATEHWTEWYQDLEKTLDLLARLTAELSNQGVSSFDEALNHMISWSPTMECLYVLDHFGTQVSDTVESPAMAVLPRTRLFYPAKKGTDHSSKEYFYGLLDGQLPRYTTEVYLSLASGKLCRTISFRFKDKGGMPYVLCLDLNAAN